MEMIDFARQLKLHPRCTLLFGRILRRAKNKGTLDGLTPHYAEGGCPTVVYSGANALEQPSAAEIEMMFEETSFPVPSALRSFSPRQGNLIQLLYGALGQAPTQAAYRVLREASAVLGSIVDRQAQVYAATLIVLTPGQYGVMTGRHWLLGVFDLNGTALWLNPDAVDAKALDAPYPASQKERSASAAGGHVAVAPWYDTMRAALAATGLKDPQLHETILRARAQQLLDNGTAPTLEAGLALATADAPKEPSAAATPAAGSAPPGAGAPAKPAGPTAAEKATTAQKTARGLGDAMRGRGPTAPATSTAAAPARGEGTAANATREQRRRDSTRGKR